MPSKIQRRDFVVGSFAGATALTGSAAASASSPSDDGDTRELIEIRAFRNTDPAKQAAVLAHVEAALLPALDRQGLERVGVFTSVEAADASVYLVIPYATPEQLLHHNDLLESDEAYQSVAADHLAVSMEDPPYTRIESRLTRAFSGMPRLEVPARESAERILELRIYESHNEHKARLKVEMFDDGEIDLMR
ncbi:MAG TPA: NIPSNAP family containing protein, partial [Planctomycetota bacterium]|nr:NIPSNAP family containing protein [Planctomycetota bacterium]